MNVEAPLKNVEDFVLGITSKSETVFPVDINITPGNHIIVLLDADDGITIEKCSQVNKALYKYIEDTGLFGDSNFSLEVSSPGVDEPLKLHRQYKKNIGRNIQVIMNDGAIKEGKLTSVSDEDITIDENQYKGKKAPNKFRDKQITIQFNQIKHTTVLVTF